MHARDCLIVLSDGRPYDHDYGDARYAREDTREALRQAKNEGITPFCITIDRESEAELRDLYGEVGYTIIDDVLSLPERLPGIYRAANNLTTDYRRGFLLSCDYFPQPPPPGVSMRIRSPAFSSCEPFDGSFDFVVE